MTSDTPLADGMDAYVAAFRAGQVAGGTLAGARLAADMNAAAFSRPWPAGLRRHVSFIVARGREIAVAILDPGGEGPRPGICYFHGGGFAFGSIESFDGVAQGLAEETGAVVVSVQYRRLPENSYRAAQEDCFAAYEWFVAHAAQLGVDVRRIAVAGDSVGALLATMTAVMARDAGGPVQPVCQLLMYGAYALTPGRPSYGRGRDPLLSVQRVEDFVRLYRLSQEAEPFHAPPLSVPDLSRLPPAVLIAAEYDPLRGEGAEYADRLAAAGVEVRVLTARHMIHGFLRALGMSPAAAREMAAAAQAVRPYLWPADREQTP
ncbi:alpha/beta hydrolase [Nitrospirillum amazonense]|uniref:alpha/beta hydrolase n=1 Tax=Nitrospirillum amazonense TaxID=28077 RepID=UPI002DD438BD|nr:alpha/beta hydrolase [Nitrospirillum amazonense]MEC4590055.1 alpha/beta hydrolase [Nitrospirillum amazonense]